MFSKKTIQRWKKYIGNLFRIPTNGNSYELILPNGKVKRYPRIPGLKVAFHGVNSKVRIYAPARFENSKNHSERQFRMHYREYRQTAQNPEPEYCPNQQPVADNRRKDLHLRHDGQRIRQTERVHPDRKTLHVLLRYQYFHQ